MVLILDIGIGNVGSVANMIKRCGREVVISKEWRDIKQADTLILPGVGHFDKGMEKIHKSGLKEILDEQVLERKKKILGICLGMQLMLKGSEEGHCEGLKWIDGYCKKFVFEEGLYKVPHMGWNLVIFRENTVYSSLNEEAQFYFVHSYYAQCVHAEEILGITKYGDKEFVSAFLKDKIMGVQFHPEKSHIFGMRLLEKFLKA